MYHLLRTCAVLSLFLAATPALAGGECGYSSSGWNAPNGAVVFNRGPGPIRNVIDAVGEYRTHSMLSHGPGRWVSHATMKTPDQRGWPGVCSLPLESGQLQYGYPGVEQVNQGGIYQFLYGGGTTEWIAWQQGEATGAAAIGDAIWYSHPYSTVQSRYDSSHYFYRLTRNGNLFNYSLYQYRTLEGSNLVPGYSVNEGIVCSTFMAYSQNYAGRGVVSAYTYSHAQLANAANSLYSGVKQECSDSLGWFMGALLTIACPFYDVCGNAGNQVANCMSANRCNTSDSGIWKGVRDNASTTATSISPDRIGGWGVHPINVSHWAPDYSHTLSWNSGGNVYGCWL